MQKDVAIFMEAVGHKVYTTPGYSEEREPQAFLMKELIREEFEELNEAFHERDIVKTADACGDLVVVILDLCNTLGINFNAVWHEVMTSNMSKIPSDGQIRRREDGKILKPDSYVPPNIPRALGLETK